MRAQACFLLVFTTQPYQFGYTGQREGRKTDRTASTCSTTALCHLNTFLSMGLDVGQDHISWQNFFFFFSGEEIFYQLMPLVPQGLGKRINVDQDREA